MKTLSHFIGLIVVASLAACGGSNNPEATETTEPAVKQCTYAYSEGSLSVTWTAYKTTEKIGVSGSFDTLHISGTQTANSVGEVFANADFSIPVSTVNSNNPDRDKKILASFFGTMTETTMLSGKVIGISDNDCSVVINMNGVSDTCLFTLTKNDTAVSLIGVLELGNWSALKSADALNKVCFDLHKGADGVSKLWPDVKLEISAGITEICD